MVVIIIIGIFRAGRQLGQFPAMSPVYSVTDIYNPFRPWYESQSPNSQWWGGSHSRAATGIEPATCGSQDERPAHQTTRPSGLHGGGDKVAW